MNDKMNVAILGAGNIANAMAEALSGIKEEVNLYAVASRSLEKAKDFASKWDFSVAYGSYEELAKDDKVDLVYVATPHSEHYKNAMLCLENGRNCLVEKAFCANKTLAEKLINFAKEKNLLLAEAMWTRYQPSKDIIRDIIDNGTIGTVKHVESDFSVPIKGVDRVTNPALAGGALLDLGIYSLTVPAMYVGTDVKKVDVEVVKADTGVDATTIAELTYENGVTARTKCSAIDDHSNYAKIIGDKGYVMFGPINVPEYIRVYDENGTLVKDIKAPIRVNGYEYQVLECKQAILDGKIETVSMPHSETIRMMGWMDSIRNRVDIVFPFETREDITHDEKMTWGNNYEK